MDDRKMIQEMIYDTEESIKFFSSAKKPDRERSACAAFLRSLNIKFNANDLQSIEDDPPDVIFDKAKFEVKEYLDDDRRRHAEFKQRLDKLRQAQKLSDLLQPYRPFNITMRDVSGRLSPFLEDYAKSYGRTLCSSLDVLVYFNLTDCHVEGDNVDPDNSRLLKQGWRSVSMITNSFAYIFFAQDSAPEFLIANSGIIKKAPVISGLFDI
ncbi:MAG: DUF1780 domain-containing protein [Nitrospirae bacterium]|nr:DUF1780 domain-containing protein [Nitrospirota bacterium]